MDKIYIGIDNGVTGSIAIIGLPSGPKYFQTPTKTEQSYTKKAQQISRIDYLAFHALLMDEVIGQLPTNAQMLAVIERPFVNPGMFKTTVSAVRALEATLIALEDWKIPHLYCDSREWQKTLLPQGLTGSTKLKKASKEIGNRLFPQLEAEIKKQKDADGLLIAEWARRVKL